MLLHEVSVASCNRGNCVISHYGRKFCVLSFSLVRGNCSSEMSGQERYSSRNPSIRLAVNIVQ